MKTKQYFRVEIKALTEEGTFDGLLSPYGSVDHGGDLVEQGAFTKTLQEHGNRIPLLWQHDETQPIGELTLDDRPDGLYCNGQLVMQLPEAQKAHLLMKARIVKGLSIGFQTLKSQVVGGVRHLKEVRLWEGSAVTFPMNDLAVIDSIKSRKEIKGDFNEELAEVQLNDAGYQMRCAFSEALWSAVFSGLGRDQIVSASQAIIEQFSAAYMAYLPAYLDLLAEAYGYDTKAWIAAREKKGGRRISSATDSELQKVIDIVSALRSAEAADGTSDSEAAGEEKSEPDIDHSAVSSLLTKAKETYKWNCNSN